jgi:ClpP class serine protease
MKAKDGPLGVVDTVLAEIEELKEEIDLVPEIITKQLNDSSFEFRPLTEEEKKQFVDSLDAKGKQILAELAGQARVRSSS